MRKLLLLLTVGACTSSSDTASTHVMGQGVYRDANTQDNGTPQQPAAPPPQSAKFSIVIKGSGTIPQVDARCATDPAGQFVATYASTAEMSSSDSYVAAFAASSGTITTPSGCTIQNLTVGAVTDVEVRGELTITTENCNTYCAASARADAEQQCGSTPEKQACRTSAETQLAASCNTQCTTQSHAIVGQISLGAAALGQVTASELKAASFGNLEANLTFDHLE